ncbi:hypothetical protein B9Z19DRAFT_1075388, partial [Tuber borchii]
MTKVRSVRLACFLRSFPPSTIILLFSVYRHLTYCTISFPFAPPFFPRWLQSTERTRPADSRGFNCESGKKEGKD